MHESRLLIGWNLVRFRTKKNFRLVEIQKIDPWTSELNKILRYDSGMWWRNNISTIRYSSNKQSDCRSDISGEFWLYMDSQYSRPDSFYSVSSCIATHFPVALQLIFQLYCNSFSSCIATHFPVILQLIFQLHCHSFSSCIVTHFSVALQLIFQLHCNCCKMTKCSARHFENSK